MKTTDDGEKMAVFREHWLDHPDNSVYGDVESSSSSYGNQIHYHGLTTAQGLAIAALAAAALGVSIVTLVQSAQSQAEMRSRYEQSYRDLATKVAINTNSTDDMRASLIARGINPNNHDITDVGGLKP